MIHVYHGVSLLLLFAVIYAEVFGPTIARHDDGRSLLWGPYRPNLLVGFRARTPDSPVIGLMWSKDDGHISESTLRHTCEQNDGLSYGWTAHDPRYGERQLFQDESNGVDLTVDFVRFRTLREGGSWATTVRGSARPHSGEPPKTRVILYLGAPGFDSDAQTGLACSRVDERIACQGSSASFGSFDLTVNIAGPASPTDRPVVTLRAAATLDEELWQAKSIYLNMVADERHDAEPDGNPNLFFVEMWFTDDFEFDVTLSDNLTQPTPGSIDVNHGLPSNHEHFVSRFEAVYSPKHPFNTDDYADLSKALLSNLFGGIGYFYGDSYASTASRAFTMVPSRPFFPRGFLWDEDFHLLILLHWDIDLAVEILLSWLARMDEDGWIAREQILGPEPRSKVPPEFQVQYSDYANPPTLFLAISDLYDVLFLQESYFGHHSHYLHNSTATNGLLQAIFPLMKRHYDWFRRSQAGNTTYPVQRRGYEGYRWRGRTSQHTLTSGLDDYPRPQPPRDGELHVDALSWVGTMAVALTKIAGFLGDDLEHHRFIEDQDHVVTSLLELHWSEKDQAFCDATIKDEIEHAFVCHRGYVSMFPFALGHMEPHDERVGHVLHMLRDPDQLWSDHGIRSLSKQDAYYGRGEDYWRGAIWINLNYLILKQLLVLGQHSGPYQDNACGIYNELRANVVENVYRSWRETGTVWEQYDADTGRGRGTQQFTGWTALIVKIMAMPNLESDGSEPSKATAHSDLHWLPAFQDNHLITIRNAELPAVLLLILAFAICYRQRVPRIIGHLRGRIKLG